MMTNLLFSQASALGKRLAMVLTMLVIVGIGQVWGAVTPLPLPYSWGAGDGKSKYTNDLGCTLNGLGSDYNTSGTLLKFDHTGDYLIIQLKDAPGTLSYNIKGNTFSGGTFTIQESADGTQYSNLGTYSKDGTQTHNLSASTRYIKFIYTTKSSGNIGLGTISITEATGGAGGNTDDGSGGGNYAITFATGNNTTATTSSVQLSTMIKDGTENVVSFSIDATDKYVYHKGAGASNATGSGLRLGKSGGKGKITFNLSEQISSQCLSSISVTTGAWDANVTVSLLVNGENSTLTTASAGNTISYTPQNPSTNLSSITLYASARAFIKKITIETTSCTTEPSVTLQPNGGTGTAKVLATTDGSLTLPECDFTYEGYRFVGWNTKAEGTGTTYQPSAKYTPTENPATLYAKWAKEYTVTYNANGGTTTCEDNNKYIAGEQVTVCTSAPTRDSYTFNGWSYSPNVAITDGQFAMPENDVTITAQWTSNKTTTSLSWSADTYSATIDAANDFPTLTIDPEAIKESVQYTSSDETIATIDANGNITLLKKGETTITTTFEETATHTGATDSYTLTVYSSNCRWVEAEIGDIQSGDEVVITMTDALAKTYALPNDEVTNETDIVPILVTVANRSLRAVSDDIIWFINKDGDNLTFESYLNKGKFLTCNNANKGIRVNNGEYKQFVIDQTYNYLKNITTSRYLGVHSENDNWYSYALTDGGNFPSKIFGQTLKFYKRECLDASKVWVEGNLTNVTCDTQLPQQLAKNGSLELTFTAADSYELPNNVTVTNATKNWDKANGTLTISNPTGNVEITISALQTYTINYDAGSGDGIKGSHDSQTKTHNIDIELADKCFTRPGYKQTGWSKTDGGQKDYDLLSQFGENANTTLYPYWTKVHTITWMADESAHDEATYLDGETLALPETAPEACQGSEFVGWTAAKDYFNATTAPTYVTAGSSVTTDATYYAVYAEVPEGEPIEEITKSYTFSSYTDGSQYAENEEHILDENLTIYTTECHFTSELRIYSSSTHNGYAISNQLPGKIVSMGFNAGNNNDNLVVFGSTDGSNWHEVGKIAVTKTTPYNDYSISFGATNYTYFKLDVEGSNQIRITSMTITYMSGSGEPSAAYANYSTTCSATYRVSYDFAEGEGICTTESVKVGNDYTICANIPTKIGYDFVGWSTADDNEAEFLKADVEAGQAIIENVSNNVELYAVWEAKTYTITWMSNGEEYTTTSHTFDAELQLPADPYTCYGAKTFVGWTEAASVNVDGSDITYINENTNPSENKTYYAVFADVTNNGSGGYDKVTEALDDYSGEFLIVYEAGNKAFNGGLSTLDATSNGIAVTINNNTIESNQTTDAAKFTIAAINDAYSIKSASGKYIGRTENENDLDESTSTIYTNTISINNDKSINIIGSGSAYLRYNTDGSRFRYYKSSTYSSQQVIALYKKSAGATLTNYTTTPTGCAEMDVAENAYVTSANGQSVKVNVPIAVNFQDGYTIDATLNDGTKFEVVSVSEITDNKATVTLAYTPDYSNNTETAEVKLTAKYGENFVTAKSFTVNGRSLPERFVIATKVGATWYALPANMNGATNPEGVVIDVDETTMTAIAPNTTVYTLFPVKTTTGSGDRYAQYGDRVRFSAVNNEYKGLWTSSSESTIRNYAVIDDVKDGSSDASYEWKITTTIVNDNWQYTLQTDQSNNQKYLRYWTAASGGAKWGTYASGNDKLYFLLVTETKPFDYKVVEWYPTKVLIQTEAAITNPIVKIGGVLVDNVTCTNKGGKLYEISGLPLVNNPTKVLTLSYTADEVTYTNSKGVPIILSRETKSISGEPFVALTKEVYNYADLVVRDGATLTMDGTQEANTLWDVTIYPTSKISVPESKKLTVHSLTLFGGIDEIYNGSTYTLNKYGVPELSLKGTLKKSISTIDYLMRVDSKQMYSLTVPYDVQLADIKYWDGTNIVLGDELWVSAYDGASRAQNQGNGKNWIYETDFESKLGAATLKAGVGYTISAELQNGVGSEYSILRMPMTSNVENDATEAAKTVAVTAWGKDANVTDNHKGWNLVGNPYMTTITGADDDNLVLGYLKETGTGPWEWMEKNYRYVTIPSDNGEWYYQQKFTEAVLPPFKNFFVQIGTTGELAFGLSTRQNAPSRYLQQEQAPREVEFELLLSNEAQSDNMGLLISEDYTPAYEINADLEKMLGTMSVYSIYNGYQLAYTALSPLNAMEEIPLGYVLPSTGEYTFALDEHGDLDDIEHIYLLDYDKNTTTDLMEDIYTFAATEKKSDKRFAISVILKEEEEVETPTQLETLEWESDHPYKFIYQDKMYILRNGLIYDAMGKQVQTINK